jgi:hypothetical protein
MLQDAGAERQRLTELYAQKWDGELLELAADIGDLTELAQQALRDEMRKRGLGEAGAPAKAKIDERMAEQEDGAERPVEFTWKTLLCECETQQQAEQLGRALERGGIESWIQGPGARSRTGTMDVTYPRVMVAADQLEHAQEVAAQPIPQDILDASKENETSGPDEFELPACPACGAGDPVLTGVDPVNTWLCEACGKEWRDATDAEPAGGH